MFASLKSKIKEETGSDISKLTSSWRTGAFLGRITLRDDSVSLMIMKTSTFLYYPNYYLLDDPYFPQRDRVLNNPFIGDTWKWALQKCFIICMHWKPKPCKIFQRETDLQKCLLPILKL